MNKIDEQSKRIDKIAKSHGDRLFSQEQEISILVKKSVQYLKLAETANEQIDELKTKLERAESDAQIDHNAIDLLEAQAGVALLRLEDHMIRIISLEATAKQNEERFHRIEEIALNA